MTFSALVHFGHRLHAGTVQRATIASALLSAIGWAWSSSLR
ncbi:hypothetical protein [Rhizocola hellebori]|nr:hypothetical protein [Rhizocola hellebori]